MEEEEDDKIDLDYLKGFNEGYMLAHHNPELVRKLATINSELSRVIGFKDGLEQFQAELIHIQQKGEPESDQPNPQTQVDPSQIDVFDQLYRQQTQAEDSNHASQQSASSLQKFEETNDLFIQLKKKQEQGFKGFDISEE